jgi:hypothetical protein
MNEIFKTRLFSFIWRAGVFSGVAVAAYLVNVSDIREIDLFKLGTIFLVTIASYVLNEGTKYFNSGG